MNFTYIVSNLGNYCPVLISFYNVLTPEGISPDIIPNISKSYYVMLQPILSWLGFHMASQKPISCNNNVVNFCFNTYCKEKKGKI